jgi:4-hydroxybenzoate polyprenyltransferase
MFPPAVAIPATITAFLMLWATLHALAGAPTILSWRTSLLAVSYVLLVLLLRVYDELKDVDTDLRLGAAGDPRYVDRPVVTGHVTKADIIALRNGIVVVLFLTNVALGVPMPFVAFAVVFTLVWLSSRWFFWPAVSRHLLLAFITHNPLSLALGAYVAAVFVDGRGMSSPPPGTAWLVVGGWLQAATWEVGRKIRAPADETDYQTYSKVLGYRLAAGLPPLFAVASSAALALVAREAHLSQVVPVFLALAALVVVVASLRFVVAPSRRTAELRPIVELAGGIVVLALLAGAIARWGIQWKAGA